MINADHPCCLDPISCFGQFTGFPRVHVAGNIGEIVEVRILFIAGAFIRSSLNFGGEGGIRTDACGTENCDFGGLTAAAGIMLATDASGQGCIDSSATQQYCSPTIDISVVPVTLSTQGTLGYNEANCDIGLDGFVKVLGVRFSIEFTLPLLPSLEAEYDIFGGFCAFGTCP